MPAITTGAAASATLRAPTASASRPPTCMEMMPATPAENSAAAIVDDVRSSFSRSEGNAPP